MVALLQSDSSLYSAHMGTQTPSEPDWSQVMVHKDEDIRVASLSNPGVSSPQYPHPSESSRGKTEWARQPRQREADAHVSPPCKGLVMGADHLAMLDWSCLGETL